MKLEGLRDGRLYCSRGRAVLAEGSDGTLRRQSTLPVPGSGTGRLVRTALTTGAARGSLRRLVGRYLTTNVWPLDGEGMVASLGRWILASEDGERWRATHELPASSGFRGVLPEALCQHEGDLYLGEYPLAEDATPRILRSTDGGATWETVVALPDVRHVHSVQSDPYGDDVWVTTGDRDDECRIARLTDAGLEVVGSGSQRWRAAELAFTPGAVLWGVDCLYAGENELLVLDRERLADEAPEPRTVGTAPTSVYHAATVPVDGDHLVAFSTGGETDQDSTAPDSPEPDGPVEMDVLAASSASGFSEWHRLATYRKRRCASDYLSPGGLLPRANAYVFLEGDPERGLFVNPYNAVPGDGSLDRFSVDRLAALTDETPQKRVRGRT